MGRTAAATDGAAAAVEEGQRHAAFAAHLDQPLLGPILSPGSRQLAGILGRIRVADHHFLVIAGGLAWYIRLLDVIVDGHVPGKPERQLARFYFNIGVTGFALWLCMAAYLIVWVKYIKKFAGEWEDYWPQAIPIATFMALSSLIAFVVAFWPVWGWLTIPAIFVLFLYAPRGLNPPRGSRLAPPARRAL